MSCHDQGTANPNNEQDIMWPLGSAGGNVATSGYLQVLPEEFTREELQELRGKAQAQIDWNGMSNTRRDLLEDLVDTLDLLDALEARDEADLGVVITNAPVCGFGCSTYPCMHQGLA